MAAVDTATPRTNLDAQRSFFVFITDQTGRIFRALMPADVQIGRKASPAALQLSGRFSLNVRDVASSTASNPVQASNDDTVLGVRLDSSPAPSNLTVLLPPAPVDGQLHFIKDASGTAGTVPIVVSSSVGKIDGQSATVIAFSYGRLGIVWSAAANEWHKISG